MYASSGAADYYLETGDKAYRATLERLWRDLTSAKMYITGGVGSRSEDEAIGEPYELPNAQAYGESCAAIGNMIWNWRMLLATGEARFADVVERALYNGVNSGMSLDGALYCYRNPLESSGEKIRNPWYNTTCCPPNLERIFASLPGYLYSTSERGLYVHLYHSSTLDWRLESGTPLEVTQKTAYPWQGRVDLTVSLRVPTEFTLFLRIPAWSARTAFAVNGSPWTNAPKRPGEYLEIRRIWQAGDIVRLDLDMSPRKTAANPLLRENVGRVAVERGPIVYALEQEDQPAGTSLFDVALAAPRGGAGTPGGFAVEFRPSLFGGVVVLKHPGARAARPLAGRPLYASASGGRGEPGAPVTLTFIPYYAWANREPQPMLVWVPTEAR
jgi:hypothetical protein